MNSILLTIENYFTMLLDCFILYRLFGYTLTYKYQPKYRFMSILPILFIQIFRYYLSMTNVFESNIANIFDVIIVYATIFLYTFLFYSSAITSKILWTVIYLLILTVGELTVLLCCNMFHITTNQLMQNNHLYFVAAAIAKMISLLIAEIIGQNKNKELLIPKYAKSEVGGSIVICLLVLFFSIQVYRTDETNLSKDLILAILFILCICMSFLTFITIMKVSGKAEDELEEQLRIKQLEMENKLNNDITNVIDNLRSLRHDMNNHIGVLKGLVCSKQYDALKEYIDAIYLELSPANEFVLVQNKAVSALLYNKTLNANLKHIEFDTTISIEDFPFPDKDMCSLLGNLFDNAIEAADKVETNRYIGFTMCKKQNNYLIHCENTYKDTPLQVKGTFITTKQTKELHGIGTKNMKSIVAKYNGTISFSYDDFFCVDISLPCT